MTIASSTDILSAARSRHDHVVDVLIAERAPNLTGHPAWPLLRPALYGLLDYGKARRMADAIAPLPGTDALETVSRLLDVKLHVQNLDRLPRTGRCVVLSLIHI